MRTQQFVPCHRDSNSWPPVYIYTQLLCIYIYTIGCILDKGLCTCYMSILGWAYQGSHVGGKPFTAHLGELLSQANRLLASNSKGLGFDSHCWSCVEASDKLRISYRLGPPSRNGYLVHRSKIGSIAADCRRHRVVIVGWLSYICAQTLLLTCSPWLYFTITYKAEVYWMCRFMETVLTDTSTNLLPFVILYLFAPLNC